jgi:hydroxylamine reductase (hybrid-cluster protein)
MFLGIESMGDHGDPELALAMNVDALVVTPNGCLPGLETLAQKFDVPTVLVDGAKSLDQLVSETMTVAVRRDRKGTYVSGTRVHRTSGFETDLEELLHKRKEIKVALKRGTIKGVVVLLGEANVKQAFFERTLTLMESCLDNRVWVLLGGELGAQGDLVAEEIQRRMGDRFSQMEIDGVCPPTCFGSFSQIVKIVPFFQDLTGGKAFSSAPGVIAFPEFFRASTWATAVSLLSLGFMVQIGSSLPFWGSPALTEVLLKDWPDLSGGRLLASPAVPDGETQAREIFSCLDTQNTR